MSIKTSNRTRVAAALILGLSVPLGFALPSQAAPVAAASASPDLVVGAPDGLDPELSITDLASRGEGEWLRYRIPALSTTVDGDIIAVFDGRPSMDDLPANIALLMRRSSDGGVTWGDTEVIRRDAAPNGYGDPSVTVDRETGDIFVFYAASINRGYAASTTGADPNDPNVLHADYSVSRDGGDSWEHHRITADLKAGKSNWAGMFAASGEGIQLRHGAHAGRLIQQYTVRINGGNYAVPAYSDDHGQTWKAGNPVGAGADENKVVELSNGDVLLVSRAAPARLVARSKDGGVSYTPFRADPELPDPANNGSIIRAYPDAPASDPRSRILLHSNTDNIHVRRNLTVRMSCDDGETWPVEKPVQTGASAYSTLTPLPAADGTLGGSYGLFYEREGYRHLSYTSFDLDWLGGVCASLSVQTSGALTPGSAGNVAVTITNQSGAELPAGTVAPTEAGWSSPGVDVPAIAEGDSVTITLPVTPPATADPRTHSVRVTYDAGGTAGVDAAIAVSGAFAPAGSFEIRPVLDAIYTGGVEGLEGDRIQPWVEVRNTGSTTLRNITFSAPAGASACTVASLAPGASTACKNASPSHVVTAADMAAGMWTTTYEASATSDGQRVSANAVLFPVDLAAGETPGAPKVTVPGGSLEASSLVRVPRVGVAGTTAATSSLTLQVPAASRASGQLNVTAGAALDDLSVTVTQLRTAGGARLGVPVQVRWPEYIADQTAGGVVADPLREAESVDVPAGRNQPVWLTVDVPAGTAPGAYDATVIVTSAAGPIGRWPMRVVVPDVELREVADRPFVLDLWAHPDAVADQLDLEPWSEEHFDALVPYWEEMAAAGQDVVNLAIVEDPWLVNHAGTIRAQTAVPYRSTVQWRWDGEDFTFNFDVFDRLVTDARAAGVGHDIHVFSMLQFQGHDRISYIDHVTGELVHERVSVGDARYREAWGAFLEAFTAHLAERGWLDDTRLAFDEQTLARMNAAYDVVRAVAPEWLDKVALAANSLAEADIAEAISFNLTFLDRVSQELIDSRRAAGQPTLFYTWNDPVKPNTVVPTPPLNVRSLPWVVEQRDLDGYLRWTFNSWPEDIWRDSTFRYGQGDEYILYPGADGPVSSIRWELFRDGQEDAEIIDIARETLGADHVAVAAALTEVDAAAATSAETVENLVDRRTDLLSALAPSVDGATVTVTPEADVVAAGGVTRLDVTVTAGAERLRDVKVSVPGAIRVDGPPGKSPINPGVSRTFTVTVPVGADLGRLAIDGVVTARGGVIVDTFRVRADIVEAIAALGEITLDRYDAPTGGVITASVPVRNVSGEDRTVVLRARDGVVFGSASADVVVAAGQTTIVNLELNPDDRTGSDSLVVELLWGDRLVLSRTVDVVAGGRFLSDLDIAASTNGWGPIELDRSNGEDEAGDGNPLTLNGRVYAKGIGAHAASTIDIDVPVGCTRLSFDYGVDDEIRSGGSMAFVVSGDGAQLWRSATITASSATGSAEVDITGVTRLTLTLDALGSNGQDHGDWAGAWVACN